MILQDLQQYLDRAILMWRQARDAEPSEGENPAAYYIDAYQCVRASFCGGVLLDDPGKGLDVRPVYWIAGRLEGASWRVRGLFLRSEDAAEVCETEEDFYAPLEVNRRAPGGQAWPGLIFPHRLPPSSSTS